MANLKSFFILDGPIGRKQFIVNFSWMILYCFVYSIVMFILHASFEVTSYNIAFFIIMWGILLISSIYVGWVNYTKRLWDILGDKGNAIFYSIAIWIANNVSGFIPVVKYIGVVFSISVLALLLFKKGKLVLVHENIGKQEDNVA